jgi:phage host-nuclease inhibitor protein Gam
MSDAKNTGARPGDDSAVLPADAERRLKQDAGTALETVKAEAASIKAEAETQLGAIADEAKAQIGQVTEHAKGIATEQKDVAAHQIQDFATAVNKVAHELESENASIAGYARTVADAANRFSGTVKEKNVDELLAMAEDFARRQPAAFVGMAALAGFAASRFLRASAAQRPSASGQHTGTAYRGDGQRRPDGHAGVGRTHDQMGGTI